MAYVTLLPVIAAEAGDKKPVVSSATVQAGLDGSYVINNVLPGAYYVVAGKLGYATTIPISYLDPDAYDQAPKEVKEALSALVTPTVVAANRASRADIVLDKGAVISGTVRFDDGEPDSQARVSLLQKEKSGKWTEFTAQEDLLSFSAGGGASTDDQGNFRLTGLPAGEYLLRTTLELQGGDVKTPGTEVAVDPNYRWDVYFGDGVRPRDAKTITLKDGEVSNGNTIEIPLAKLHAISGAVLNAETGAPINRADVELHNADDDSTCTVTSISPATGQFHFPYVAEGEYTLKVRNASDVIPGKGDEKPIRTYDDASQPLIVKGEMNGLTIQVKPKPAATAQP
jgi:protocatechuate 3,4-dioxygenase beta subunit